MQRGCAFTVTPSALLELAYLSISFTADFVQLYVIMKNLRLFAGPNKQYVDAIH